MKGGHEVQLPDHHDIEQLANDFGDFFVRKIDIIRDKIHNVTVEPTQINSRQPSATLESFAPLSEEEVQRIIMSSSNATCGLDPIPSWLLKQCLKELLPVVTQLVNQSLVSGVVPDQWKTALLTPILKKQGLDRVFSNYRPVSNLSFISKLVEKAVVQQLVAHSESSAPLPSVQSAYRKNHSPETALIKVQNDILMCMDKQEVVLLVMLDLSAAFDTVDTSRLLETMNIDFGVGGSALDWLRCYLRGRGQRVVLKGRESRDFMLKCGVPQGSCLGPVLFLFYVSRLYTLIANYLPSAHGFSDDNQLYLAFRPSPATSQTEAVTAIEHCITAVRSWYIENELMINDIKTEFAIFGTRQQLAKVGIASVKVGDTDIKPVQCVRNLGAWFDSNMSMDTHVNKVCAKAYYGLYRIRQIRKFLSEKTTKTLVHAFIIAHLDYCNALLNGIPARATNQIQRVFNSAARVVCLVGKFDRISPVLAQLHWLPVKFRVQFKILLLVFKCLTGEAPEYLRSMIQLKRIGRPGLRSESVMLLEVPQFKHKTLGGRSFSVAAPRMWNNLPANIQYADSLVSFKSLLKAHLFAVAYRRD